MSCSDATLFFCLGVFPAKESNDFFLPKALLEQTLVDVKLLQMELEVILGDVNACHWQTNHIFSLAKGSME